MSETNIDTTTYTAEEALARILAAESSPEMVALKQQLYRRIVSETIIRPSRMPAPLNITEIGGYLNLLMEMNKAERTKMNDLLLENKMLKQTLTSILGLPEEIE